MAKINYLAACLLAAVSLTGCKQEKNFSYYMKHPHELRKEIARCQKLKPSVDKKTKQQCDIIMNAAGRFMAQVTIQQADPETFGETILKEEYVLSILQAEKDKARQLYESLKNKNAPEKELKTAQDKMVAAENHYQDKLNQIQELLAVIGLGSPG